MVPQHVLYLIPSPCSLNLSVTRLYRRSRVTSAAVKQMFKGANDDDEAEEEGQAYITSITNVNENDHLWSPSASAKYINSTTDDPENLLLD
ncbi:hypothetical protein IW262DRAFT_1459063 [Armillaria fumosa]|nr:hypothetical protein IW262DRAFT_1459063 [Armillaria fumosa]